MIIKGVCKSDYNIIDQNHIDAIDKKIYVTTDTAPIRQLWSKRTGQAWCEDRAVIHIRGRSNYSHILNRPARFHVEIQPSFGKRSRLVLKLVDFEI